MINTSELLDGIKISPFREIVITAPHCGRITFCGLKNGDSVVGPRGQWREKPGTQIAILERERNPKPICAQEKGRISSINSELEGQFVEAGAPLAVIRHFLTAEEVENIILQRALYLFRAPERAKYYFTPEVDKKIRASDANSVQVREGMELLIMSRMKREAALRYHGPEGIIYATYFKYNQNVDAGEPLIGVCPADQLAAIQEVIARVHTEWREKE